MRPVSITYTPISQSDNEYWVVVANQWGNPNIQGDSINIQRFPNDAFFQADLTQPNATDNQRNIHLFRFNSANGNLASDGGLDYKSQLILQTTQDDIGQPGANNFLGLTGFELPGTMP